MNNVIKASLPSNKLVKQIYTEKSQYDNYELDKDEPFKGIYKFLCIQITDLTSYVKNVLNILAWFLALVIRI